MMSYEITATAGRSRKSSLAVFTATFSRQKATGVGTAHREATVHSAAIAVEFSRQKVTVMGQRHFSLCSKMTSLD